MSFIGNLLPNLILAVVTIILGGIVGNWLSARWAIYQKRRELLLEANSQFYQLYGEFFAIWKLWNYAKGPNRSKFEAIGGPEHTRWNLLERAALAEGKLEAILVKLASERILSQKDIETLGQFRQGYQMLRTAMRDDRPLSWWSSNNPQYLEFKRLACYVAAMLVQEKRLSPDKASEALKNITSNIWEENWVQAKDNDAVKQTSNRSSHTLDSGVNQ